MLILLLFLKTKGYTDAESAHFFTARFIGVLFLSLPFGLYIKTKKLKPYFVQASILLPIITVVTVFAIDAKIDFLIYSLFLLWGVIFSLAEICKIPFILRNEDSTHVMRALSYAYATWSLGAVFSGIIIFTASNLNADFFTERNCLILIALISLIGLSFSLKISEVAPVNKEKVKIKSYDWRRICFALTPTFLIAVGAGMSIPFIPLFFEQVFFLKYDSFSGYGFFAYLIVFIFTINASNLREKLGFKSIPLTQSLSVICLISLGLTEYITEFNIALATALVFYILRQPLMNLAQPLTTDLIMNYVGKDNHEISSALMAMIWNGSFALSGFIFAILRSADLKFSTIFFITGGLYLIAIIWIIFLIKKVAPLNLTTR